MRVRGNSGSACGVEVTALVQSQVRRSQVVKSKTWTRAGRWLYDL
ncbi:hypothetical protein FTUN_2864 [Frigoriglobus tundricola]|uniref:Uncharacterized protein n=1 Tax=Frigoriglobus tundricola TaxID=2774151 RepID=A0A6M5YMM8_9BACT|nr:hypothetical protein FTUN_2864 [Frigoriglobus tundricola]